MKKKESIKSENKQEEQNGRDQLASNLAFLVVQAHRRILPVKEIEKVKNNSPER